jgi:hypothetical protein
MPSAVSAAILGFHTIAFPAPPSLPPKDSLTCWTPWSVFQDGSFKAAHVHCAMRVLPEAHLLTQTTRSSSPPAPHPAHPAAHYSARPQTRHSCTTLRSRDRFPFNNFTPYLTPFSRCFSSFPHGTCSLSVSRPYLALDGVYHPFELHSQATRLVDAPDGKLRTAFTGLSPSAVPLSREFTPRTPSPPARLDPTTHALRRDSKFELFLLHSPLLEESLLVSFPPLTDMLKFSG